MSFGKYVTGIRVTPDASATDDLLQLQSATGTTLVRVDVNGTQTVQIGAAATKGLIVRAAASQTANLQEWQDSTGTVLAGASSNGYLFTGSTAVLNTSGGSAATIQASVQTSGPTVRGLVVRGSASQTAFLQEWQNSSSTAVAFVDSGGGGRFIRLAVNQGLTSGITAFISTLGTTEVGMAIRGIASQTADLQQWQNSAGSVLVYITSSGVVVGGSGFYTAGTTSSQFIAGSATTTPIILKAAASQSNDLMRIQNSSGTDLAKFASNGAFYGPLATISGYVVLNEANSGGRITITKATAQMTAPGSGNGVIYFRDGTNANTLKLVVRAGTAGAETTILDNIPQT